MQYSSDSYQLVHTHNEHWWHCSLTCSQSPQIFWIDDDWEGHFPIRSSPIRPPLNSYPRSLHHLLWNLHQVCLSSNRIFVHSSMCSQWLSIISLIDPSLRPDLFPHHLNTHIMHSEVRLPFHGPLARYNPQDPLLYVFSEIIFSLLNHKLSPKTCLGSTCSLDMFQGTLYASDKQD